MPSGARTRATARDDRREIVDVNENIGGKHEVIFSAAAAFRGEKAARSAVDQTIVQAFRSRLRDHRRRQIDADQPIDKGAKGGAGEPGAAAEIEHGAKVHRPLGGAHRRFDRVAQQRRAAIMQMLGERGVVAAGILVEQPAHIGLGHRRSGFAGAEPGELQPRAVIILRIRVARPLESGDGAGAVAEPVADGAEREPGGGEVRRQLDRLRQNIGGSEEIAARRQVDRRTCSAGRR